MYAFLQSLAGVNGEGEGERERGRKMGFWELGTRERLLQNPHFFISAHRFSGNPIKLTVNATTNQKQAHAFLHDWPRRNSMKRKVRIKTFFESAKSNLHWATLNCAYFRNEAF